MRHEQFFEDILGPKRSGHLQFMSEQFTMEKWYKWDDPHHVFRDRGYLDLRSDRDVWYSVYLYSERKRSAETALNAHAVYMDADTCAPENFRLPPSYVVESSEGRYQVYWLLDSGYEPEAVQQAGRRIAVAHKHQGCDQSGWIPTKMLRVPGTTNTKYMIPFRVSVVDDNRRIYTLAEIEKAYDDIELGKIEVIESSAIPGVLPRLSDALNKLPDDIWHLYEDEVPEGGSWSSRMWALLVEMFRAGFTSEEAYVVAWAAKCNKYHPNAAGKLTQQGVKIPERHNPEEVTWREVLKAQREQGKEVPEDREPADVVKPAPKPESKYAKADFLTPDERVLLAETTTFIDDYVAWVASRTDSDPRYQRTLAYQLLSCIYGDMAFFDPGHGAMGLNLWVLICGGTTWSRKSTARSLMLKVLHAAEHDAISGTVDIGSDFTPEGLNKELAERDGMTSLIHRDEIHGFFREIYTKNYMSGAIERLTELYDGKVQVSIRATKGSGNKKRATTTFNIMGLGIFEHISEVLNASNFESGFLTRFVWCVVDEPEVTAERIHVQLREVEYDGKYEDQQIEEWIEQFNDIRQNYLAGSASRQRLTMTEIATDRLNEFGQQIMGLTDERYKWESGSPIGSSAQRLIWSTMKSAGLLAVHDGSRVIEHHHILSAIEQAEYWYDDLTRAIESVAASEFQRSVQELELYIAKARTSRRKLSAIYSHFSQHRTADVTEWIQALENQGKAEYQDGKTYLALHYEAEDSDG